MYVCIYIYIYVFTYIERIEKAQEAGREKAQAELRKQDANQLKRMHALEMDGSVAQAQKKAHAEHLLHALTDGQPSSSSSSSMGPSCQLRGGTMVERANTITKVVFLACSQFKATGCKHCRPLPAKALPAPDPPALQAGSPATAETWQALAEAEAGAEAKAEAEAQVAAEGDPYFEM